MSLMTARLSLNTRGFGKYVSQHVFLNVITAVVVVCFGMGVNVTRDPKQPGQLQQQSGLFIGRGTLSDALLYQ